MKQVERSTEMAHRRPVNTQITQAGRNACKNPRTGEDEQTVTQARWQTDRQRRQTDNETRKQPCIHTFIHVLSLSINPHCSLSFSQSFIYYLFYLYYSFISFIQSICHLLALSDSLTDSHSFMNSVRRLFRQPFIHIFPQSLVRLAHSLAGSVSWASEGMCIQSDGYVGIRENV